MNVQADHVHLVVQIPPKYAVSQVMGYLKGKLAIRLFQQFEKLGKRFWGRHLWSRGYCVSSVGIDETIIREYVRWQEEKEKESEKETEKLQGELFKEDKEQPVTAHLLGQKIKPPPLAEIILLKLSKYEKYEIIFKVDVK